jgi:hypothetical protein
MEQLRLQKEQEKEAEILMRGELQEEQRKALLDTHQKEISSLLTALDVERVKQEANMRKKMEEKQQRKRQSVLKRLEQQERQRRREEEEQMLRLSSEAEQAWHDRLQHREQTIREAVTKLKRASSKPGGLTRQSSSVSGMVAADSGAVQSAVPSLVSSRSFARIVLPPSQPVDPVLRMFKLPPEEELFSILERSPLYVKLNDIEHKIAVLRSEWDRLMKSEDVTDAKVDGIISELRAQLAQLTGESTAH